MKSECCNMLLRSWCFAGKLSTWVICRFIWTEGFFALDMLTRYRRLFDKRCGFHLIYIMYALARFVQWNCCWLIDTYMLVWQTACLMVFSLLMGTTLAEWIWEGPIFKQKLLLSMFMSSHYSAQMLDCTNRVCSVNMRSCSVFMQCGLAHLLNMVQKSA